MARIHSSTESPRVDEDDDQLPHFPLTPPEPTASDTSLGTSNSPSNRSQLSDEEKFEDLSRAQSSTFSRLGFEQTDWIPELLALLLSLIAFGVLVAILWSYDHRPLKDWQYNRLTLNGLVALLSTICRAALLIPVAAALSQGKWLWYSRGTLGKPLGDLVVFDEASRGALGSIRLLWRIKGRHLVSCGALLTILALAFDTVSQQVLSVEFRTVIDRDPSAAASVPRSEVYDRVLEGLIPIADLPMQASIFTGILTQNLTDLPVYCSSGNCTWPIIPTLAMCGDCTSVESNLTNKCNSTHCTLSLPSGNSITGPIGESNSTAGGIVFEVMRTNGTVYKDSALYVQQFEAIGIPWEEKKGLNPNTSDLRAHECALWFCVQAYRVSVRHGRQWQETIGTWSKTGKDLTFVDLPPEFNVAPNVTFGVSPAAYAGLAIVMGNIINEGASVSKVGKQNGYSRDAVQALWRSTKHWRTLIDNIALSISNNIRLQAPAANTTTYAGTPYTTASLVRVRWAWLAFPGSMVVASVVFLLLSMWETRRNRVNGWKANPLPLLFTDVDGELVRKVDGATTLAHFKQAVGKERVLLERDALGRWHFKQQQMDL